MNDMDKTINKTAVIKIIIWSIVAISLLGLMVTIMKGNFPFKLPFNATSIISYDNEEKYSVGNGELNEKELSELEINWTSGDINVIPYDGESIVISEDKSDSLDEDEKLRYLYEDNKLTIQYCQSGKRIGSLFGNSINKELEIKVPNDIIGNIKKIKVNAVSADINLNEFVENTLSLDKLLVESVSGKIEVANITVDEVNVSTVSGDVKINNSVVESVSVDGVSAKCNISGSVNKVDVDTVSGEVDIDSIVCPSKIDVDGVSGDITLTIPDNEGFTAKLDGVSGDLDSDFDTSKHDEEYVYGDGSAEFEFDGVSADVTINKKK